jgi:hypothetical protein
MGARHIISNSTYEQTNALPARGVRILNSRSRWKTLFGKEEKRNNGNTVGNRRLQSLRAARQLWKSNQNQRNDWKSFLT